MSRAKSNVTLIQADVSRESKMVFKDSLEIYGVELRAVAFEPGFRGFRGRAEFFAQRPEFRAMVHLAQMGDLMGGEIIDDAFRRHDDAPGKAQVSLMRARAPAASCVLHGDGPCRPAN